MAANNYRFAENDSLLCYHGPMLYEAKCLKRRKSSDGKAQYFIHYKGWNSKWEEWVDDDRVLAVNSVNLNKMASLKEIHSNSKKSGTKRSITVVKEETVRNTTPPIKGRKRKHSEISTESAPIINVSSPSEPKPKKRGRPPKLSTNSKIDSSETNEASEVIETAELGENVETSELIKVHEATETNELTEQIKETKAIKGKELIEEKSQTIDSNTTEAVFIVPAPVVRSISVIDIPILIKKRLAHDFVMTTKNNQVLKFPYKFTTEKLIRAFICQNSKLGPKHKERSLNIGLTLIQYFNRFIHKQLLFSEEKLLGIKKKAKACLVEKLHCKLIKGFHFKNQLSPKKMWHYVYGPTYLLRLIVELPKWLTISLLNDKQLEFVVKHLGCFIKFVVDNIDKYFAEDQYKTIDETKTV